MLLPPPEQNLLIHADNLPVLRALSADYSRRFALAYLDPPYTQRWNDAIRRTSGTVPRELVLTLGGLARVATAVDAFVCRPRRAQHAACHAPPASPPRVCHHLGLRAQQ